MTRIISEAEFATRLRNVLERHKYYTVVCGAVTGPGRSGAIAAVYASHLLGLPFIPFGARCPPRLHRLLLIDTARESGRTLRKAARRYANARPVVIVAFEEPPRVAFWYEAEKPQRYRHEVTSALWWLPSQEAA